MELWSTQVLLLGTRKGFTEERAFEEFPGGPVAKTPCSPMQGPGFWSLIRELNFEDEVGVFQDKSQEQEDLRKKEMKWQDIACNSKHLFWELQVFFCL